MRCSRVFAQTTRGYIKVSRHIKFNELLDLSPYCSRFAWVSTATTTTATTANIRQRVLRTLKYYAVVTCEIKLFQNYFSLRRRPPEIILFHRVQTCLKLFQNYFTGLLQLVNIFQHVRCR